LFYDFAIQNGGLQVGISKATLLTAQPGMVGELDGFILT
jgi:hypothetical protein